MSASAICIPFLLAYFAVGSAVRPVVNFTPDWSKIFYGESIIMTCDVESTEQGDLVYHWYKDNNRIHTGKRYTIEQAQHSDIGDYQCQTGTSDKSDTAKLKVLGGYVVLETPLHVYEGDNVTLKCRHYPNYDTHQTVFYKDQKIIQDWGLESELFVENIDVQSTWRYKCKKQVKHHLIYYHHSDEVTISVEELFTLPVLRYVEGDPVTLTCDTHLSPLRQTTELQFAFYRNGENIQEFSQANSCTIAQHLTIDSASYKCQVRTLSKTVEKTSLDLEFKGKSLCCSNNQIPQIPGLSRAETPAESESSVLRFILPAVLLTVLVAIAIFIYRRKIWTSLNNQQQAVCNYQSGGGEQDCRVNMEQQKPFNEPQKGGKALQDDFVLC